MWKPKDLFHIDFGDRSTQPERLRLVGLAVLLGTFLVPTDSAASRFPPIPAATPFAEAVQWRCGLVSAVDFCQVAVAANAFPLRDVTVGKEP